MKDSCYSLYLWHQPLLAFYRHWRSPELFEIWAIIAATFVLSAVTFHFVERPARTASGGPRAVLGLSAVPLAALAAVGLTGHLNQGFPSRFNPQLTAAIVEARSDSRVYIEHNRYDDDRCRFSATHSDTETRTRIHACHESYGPGVLIFGDSHATNLYHAVIRNSRAASHPFVVGLSENGCHLPHAPASCHYEGVLDLISSDAPPFSHVVYEKAGHQMLHRPSAANREDARSAIRDDARAAEIAPDVARIEGVIDFLRDASPSVEIVWFGPRIEPLVREEELYEDDCEMDLGFAKSHKRAFHGLDAFLDDRLSQEQAIRYISQIEAFDFSFPRDLGTCDALYWMDLNHFSAAGEAEFGSRFDLVSYLTDNPDLNGAAAE